MDNALLCQRGNADGTALVIQVSHFCLYLAVQSILLLMKESLMKLWSFEKDNEVSH